jgi:hypothetical protein
MARKPNDQLRLRFYDPSLDNGHTVPAAALAQSLDALQRVILLLAMRLEGHAPGRRMRPSSSMQQRYKLLCDLPTRGSYVTPVHIVGSGLLGASDVSAVSAELSKLLSAIGNSSETELEHSIADETWRRFALEALERLAPHRSTGTELEVTLGRARVLDSINARPFIEKIMRKTKRHRAPGVVLGEFKRIDFMKREFTVRHLLSARDLAGGYNDYVEETLLDHPRAMLLVFGTITRDLNGAPTSIDDVERIEAVDMEPIAVSSFQIGNKEITATQPLYAALSFDESDALFTAEIPSLRLSVCAETRDLLNDALNDELALVWKRYATADDAKLTPAAQSLKVRLLLAFAEGTNAKEAS